MKYFNIFVTTPAVIVIFVLLMTTIVDLAKNGNNLSFGYVDPLLACISIVCSALFFVATYKLTVFLAQPSIELNEVKHVLKDDQSGYESFAIFKNNSKREIVLEHYVDEKTKSIYQIFMHGIGEKTISVLFGENKKVLTPGSFTSFKIADVSFDFVESQQFYRLNKKQKHINIATKETGINIVFSYKDKTDVKKIFVPIYPYNYPKIEKQITKQIPKNNEELKAVYLFLNKELSFVFEDKIYYKLKKDQIEVFQIVEIDGAWNEKRLLALDEERDNLPKNFLEKMHRFFFTDEEDNEIVDFLKKINAIVLEYDNLTLCKSYLNPSLSRGGNLMYEYRKNASNDIPWHKIWQKILLVEQSIENTIEKNEKEFIEMDNHKNKDSSFNDQLLKILILSMIPLSVIGLILIGVVLTLILL